MNPVKRCPLDLLDFVDEVAAWPTDNRVGIGGELNFDSAVYAARSFASYKNVFH